MHDLIEQMGQDIVKNECLDDPGRRSRLWCYDDVFEVLSEDMGTDAVKGIVLDLPTRKELDISPSAFTHMRRLKLLIILNAQISGGPICLPNDLRWLEWPGCPLSTPVYVPKKLVCFHVPDSQIKEFGGNLKDFRMLKDINFKNCKFLTRVPDVSLASHLERLELSKCKSLVEVHQSVGCLDKLEVLYLNGCTNLSIFPSALKTKSLHELDLGGCRKLEKFPDILAKIEHLKYLMLQGTAIKELPASIDNLVSVDRINLKGCENLVTLPSSIFKLQNLWDLDLTGCSNFATFPMNLEESTDPHGSLGFPEPFHLYLEGCCNLLDLEFLKDSSKFPQLWTLDLSMTKFTHMPNYISKYDNLHYLYFDGCEQLQEIPQLPPNTRIIRANNCRSLTKLPDFSSLSNFDSVYFASCSRLFLEEFNLPGVSILEHLRKTEAERISSEILLIGGKMPGWIRHCEEGSIFKVPDENYEEASISFTVPHDLDDKYLGLALCVVLGPEKGKAVDVEIEYRISVNGLGACRGDSSAYALESDHVWLQFKNCPGISNRGMCLQYDWSHFQVLFRVSKASIKKCGFRLICQRQEDDLKVELQPPQPIEWWDYGVD
ncbi:hypothetical protein EUGRSUZ_H02100 [Eucalyptus grandis]|uniref:Uncharacterized protein n=2 Tax=Eucalyptus grandis TaxID=71139 RepID=A0ACC3JQM9_EUCGR|nr:hypothetical protein EUGRSUZ_H02100 [Eucalyptus grandis]